MQQPPPPRLTTRRVRGWERRGWLHFECPNPHAIPAVAWQPSHHRLGARELRCGAAQAMAANWPGHQPRFSHRSLRYRMERLSTSRTARHPRALDFPCIPWRDSQHGDGIRACWGRLPAARSVCVNVTCSDRARSGRRAIFTVFHSIETHAIPLRRPCWSCRRGWVCGGGEGAERKMRAPRGHAGRLRWNRLTCLRKCGTTSK